MIQGLGQVARGAQVDVDLLDHVDGQTNGAGLIHDGPFDGLPNPPGGISGETETTLRIEFFHRADQTEITFFDQIQQGQTTVEIASCNLDDQAQVTLDHLFATGFITLLRQAGVIDLLLGRQ